jgi:23S rRNA (cytosine1962-C5)-methyltransferase
VKVFSYAQGEAGLSFWKEKIHAAYELRHSLGLTDSSSTTAYRLVFGEGDGLPGLIVDYYDGVCVIQAQTRGMQRITGLITECLKDVYGDRLKAVYDKSDHSSDHVEEHVRYLFGDPQTGTFLETGHRFMVDWEKGQKTGFFLDQRGNRMFAQHFAKGKTVLNAFCYSGAFSVYALKGGATMVHSVDGSKQAIEWTGGNIRLNDIDPQKHHSTVADMKKFLTETSETYDMIILDPPAFAKTHTVTHNAIQAYRFINAEAMKKLGKNGILFTFSCSQAINRENFQSMIMSAALETGREIRILHHLSQGPDHPVSIYHPEGEYLKGLILHVA